MTAKAFLFRSFLNKYSVVINNGAMNRKLFEFYTLQSRPQYAVQSFKEVSVIYECEAESVMNDEFMNYKFKAVRGSDKEEFLFSFVGLPLMNLHEQFMLFSIFSKEKNKYMKQILHVKNMIRFCFMEMCRIDMEMDEVLKKKIIFGHCDQRDGLENMRNGQI